MKNRIENSRRGFIAGIMILLFFTLITTDFHSIRIAKDFRFIPTIQAQSEEPPMEEQFEDFSDIEDEKEIETGKIIDPFKVKLTVGPQSPWSGKVPLYVNIESKIDASRAEVVWSTQYGISIEHDKSENFFPLAKGARQNVTGYLTAERAGTYTLTVNVTDWGYGRNFSSTDSIRIEINEDLIVTPSHPDRAGMVMIRYAVIALASVIFIGILILLIRKSVQWLKVWLRPPQ